MGYCFKCGEETVKGSLCDSCKEPDVFVPPIFKPFAPAAPTPVAEKAEEVTPVAPAEVVTAPSVEAVVVPVVEVPVVAEVIPAPVVEAVVAPAAAPVVVEVVEAAPVVVVAEPAATVEVIATAPVEEVVAEVVTESAVEVTVEVVAERVEEAKPEVVVEAVAAPASIVKETKKVTVQTDGFETFVIITAGLNALFALLIGIFGAIQTAFGVSFLYLVPLAGIAVTMYFSRDKDFKNKKFVSVMSLLTILILGLCATIIGILMI
jgi:hypothetical protein